MKTKRFFILALSLALLTTAMLFAGCSKQDESADIPDETAEEEADTIDYMVLVNKQNLLPEGWEEALEVTTITNSVGDEVQVESKAYEAYCALKEQVEKDLEGYEKGEVRFELDSAYRTVEAQQKIWDDFVSEKGEDYARTYVAVPGTSEHHTGLALDLYFTIDGKEVYENDDLFQYPDIWEAVHARLPEYGFILRFPEGRESITGYAYEPWHIRYVDDPEIAREITESGLTLEEYLDR